MNENTFSRLKPIIRNLAKLIKTSTSIGSTKLPNIPVPNFEIIEDPKDPFLGNPKDLRKRLYEFAEPFFEDLGPKKHELLEEFVNEMIKKYKNTIFLTPEELERTLPLSNKPSPPLPDRHRQSIKETINASINNSLNPPPYNRIPQEWIVVNPNQLQNNPYAKQLLNKLDSLVMHTKMMALNYDFVERINKPSDKLPRLWGDLNKPPEIKDKSTPRELIQNRHYLLKVHETYDKKRNSISGQLADLPKHFSDKEIKEGLAEQIKIMHAMGLLDNKKVINNLIKNGWTLEDLAAAGFLLRVYGRPKIYTETDPYSKEKEPELIDVGDYLTIFPNVARTWAKEKIYIPPDIEFYNHIYELDGIVEKDRLLREFFQFYF